MRNALWVSCSHLAFAMPPKVILLGERPKTFLDSMTAEEMKKMYWADLIYEEYRVVQDKFFFETKNLRKTTKKLHRKGTLWDDWSKVRKKIIKMVEPSIPYVF